MLQQQQTQQQMKAQVDALKAKSKVEVFPVGSPGPRDLSGDAREASPALSPILIRSIPH